MFNISLPLNDIDFKTLEKEQFLKYFLKYWVEVLIKDCRNSKERLEKMEVRHD